MPKKTSTATLVLTLCPLRLLSNRGSDKNRESRERRCELHDVLLTMRGAGCLDIDHGRELRFIHTRRLHADQGASGV